MALHVSKAQLHKTIFPTKAFHTHEVDPGDPEAWKHVTNVIIQAKAVVEHKESTYAQCKAAARRVRSGRTMLRKETTNRQV
jgi:hypothetical protein